MSEHDHPHHPASARSLSGVEAIRDPCFLPLHPGVQRVPLAAPRAATYVVYPCPGTLPGAVSRTARPAAR